MDISKQSSEWEKRIQKSVKYNIDTLNSMCDNLSWLRDATRFFRFAARDNEIYFQSVDEIDTAHYILSEEITYDNQSIPPLGLIDIDRLPARIQALFGSMEQNWLKKNNSEQDRRYIFTVVISEWKITSITREKCTIEKSKKISRRTKKEVNKVLSKD